MVETWERECGDNIHSMLSPVIVVTPGQVSSGVGGIVAGILIPLIVVIAVAAVIVVVVGVIM